MKWLAILFLIVVFGATDFAQINPSETADSTVKWIRVGSDDGEFSIEVPEKYLYFFDQVGFSVSTSGMSSNLDLKQVRLLKSFVGGTLMSFECYEGSKSALEALLDGDDYPKAKSTKSEIKKGTYSIKQLIRTTEQSHMIRQYFYSKKNIYILTAASRNGVTSLMRHFLDSLKFTPNISTDHSKETIKFSSLSVTKTEYEVNENEPYPLPKSAKTPGAKKDPDEKPLVLLYKPHPSYTNAARQLSVVGDVLVRVTFSSEGYVSKVIVLKGLPEGIVSQVFFAVIRINFLPPETNGKVGSISKHIEYGFSVY